LHFTAAENLDGTYLNSNFGFDYVKLYDKLLKIWLMQKVIKKRSASPILHRENNQVLWDLKSEPTNRYC